MVSSSTTPQVDPDRLLGWKEISAFVGKGLRTVQRWEKLYGLPVRRLGDGSDIVFASRREIEAWLAQASRRSDRPNHELEHGCETELDDFHDTDLGGMDDAAGQAASDEASPSTLPSEGNGTPVMSAVSAGTSGDSPTVGGEPVAPAAPAIPVEPVSPARRRALSTLPAWAIVGSVVALALVSGARWASMPAIQTQPVQAHGQPHRWEVDGKRLRVLDSANRQVWEKEFSQEFVSDAYDEFSQKIWLEDLDGDGPIETSVVVLGKHQWPNSSLVVVNEDGRVRFEHKLATTVRFGDTAYSSPWLLARLFVTAGERGKDLWAVSFHVPLFPSALERLDPATGAVRSTYWSNGYIDLVRAVRFNGRETIAVGATSNDTRGASVALFASDHVVGSAPAERTAYRCADCPEGAPDAFVVFPRPCFLAEAGDQPTIAAITVDDGGRMIVGVQYTRSDNTVRQNAVITYYLTPDLELYGLDMNQAFESAHARAKRDGLIDHDLGDADHRLLSQVRRWSGNRFVEVSGRQVRH